MESHQQYFNIMVKSCATFTTESQLNREDFKSFCICFLLHHFPLISISFTGLPHIDYSEFHLPVNLRSLALTGSLEIIIFKNSLVGGGGKITIQYLPCYTLEQWGSCHFILRLWSVNLRCSRAQNGVLTMV